MRPLPGQPRAVDVPPAAVSLAPGVLATFAVGPTVCAPDGGHGQQGGAGGWAAAVGPAVVPWLTQELSRGLRERVALTAFCYVK